MPECLIILRKTCNDPEATVKTESEETVAQNRKINKSRMHILPLTNNRKHILSV